MANITRIRELAKALNLWNVARGKIDLSDESIANLDYLQVILESELDLRARYKTIKLRKASKLPQMAFDDTNLNQGLQWQIRQLSNLDWLDESQNIILLGKCGTGKTSLAIQLGEAAISRGQKTYYTSFDNLIEIAECKESHSKSGAIFSYIKSCDLIVIDDFFYILPDRTELQSFYRMIMFLNETRSILLITNRELSKWTGGVEDSHLCQTLLDRLTANCQIIWLD